MIRKLNRKKIAAGSLVILILALMLNLVLGVSSFEKIYKTALMNKFEIVSKDIKRTIETAVNLEKPIERFRNMDTILLNYLKQEKELTGIDITLPTGRVIYSTDKKRIDKAMVLKPLPRFSEEKREREIVKYNNNYYISLPIFYKDKRWEGTIIVYFNKNLVEDEINTLFRRSFIYLLIVFSIGLLLLMLSIMAVSLANKRFMIERRWRVTIKKQYFAIIIIWMVLNQGLFTYINNEYFQENYIRLAESHVKTISLLAENNIEEILKKGIPITKLNRVELLLKDIVGTVAECREIKITDMNANLLYKASKDSLETIYDENFISSMVDIEELPGLNRRVMLSGLKGNEGFIIFDINRDLISKRINSQLLDSLTVIIVSLIFSFEMLILFFMIIRNDLGRNSGLRQLRNVINRNYTIIRPVAFVFYFADAIPLSFLPLFIKQLSPESYLGITGDMLISLPISAYMLGVAIFLPIAGYLLSKIAVKQIFVISSLLTFISFILTAFASNFTMLILVRFIAGMGYGGMVISGQTFVVKHTDSDNRTTGFSELMAGFFAGNICAVAIGGLMANRIGYQATLLTGAAISACFIFFILIFIKYNRPIRLPKHDTRGQIRLKDILKLVRNRSFMAALLFESIPAQITFIGFIYYLCPLYLNSINVSQSTIGRALTGYGLAVIFLGPVISKLADRIKNDRIFMIIGNTISGLALMVFFLFDGIFVIIGAIFIIGLGTSMLASTEASYISLTKDVKKLGVSNVMSAFRTLERAGQISGPIIAGFLISSFQYSKAIGIIGLINFIGIIMFMFFSENLRKKRVG